MSVKTFAAIDVGSYELSMKIFEFSGKNNMREIDHVSRRLDLGSDTYATGKISRDKMDELCRTLKEFAGIMESYKVDDYKAYGTSAIRETENSTIMLDQIAQRTGIKMVVLSNSEQRFLDYKSIASKGESFRRIIEEKTAIVDIGGGSIQLSLFDNDTLVSTQNLRLGVLRIQEVMNHLNVGYMQLEKLVDEMVTAQLSAYKKLYLKDREIQNIIIVDDYLSPWAVKRIGKKNDRTMVETADFNALMEILRTGNMTEIARSLDIAEERVPLVFISTVLTRRIARLMGANRIWAPGVTLCDGIAYEYGESIKMFRGEHDFEQDIVACAMNISKRYMGSSKRAETLETITTTIFDSMKKVHGLGGRERLYLRLAAILHDCGKYISLMDIGEASYNIIMATEIIGLSHREREIVANIVRFNHNPFVYYEQSMGTKALGRETYLIVAKLTAILRLSASMDYSHKQKLKGLKAVLRDNELHLSADTMEDITLETGFFAARAEFFQEVFSVTPVLKQRKPIYNQ
jgi:exopolyphosphatase/guanosine-5'-triphosphate,3'-diphosphate pyrophosphatase